MHFQVHEAVMRQYIAWGDTEGMRAEGMPEGSRRGRVAIKDAMMDSFLTFIYPSYFILIALA